MKFNNTKTVSSKTASAKTVSARTASTRPPTMDNRRSPKLDDRGVALQNIIIVSVVALVAVAATTVIWNAIRKQSLNVDTNVALANFASEQFEESFVEVGPQVIEYFSTTGSCGRLEYYADPSGTSINYAYYTDAENDAKWGTVDSIPEDATPVANTPSPSLPPDPDKYPTDPAPVLTTTYSFTGTGNRVIYYADLSGRDQNYAYYTAAGIDAEWGTTTDDITSATVADPEDIPNFPKELPCPYPEDPAPRVFIEYTLATHTYTSTLERTPEYHASPSDTNVKYAYYAKAGEQAAWGTTTDDLDNPLVNEAEIVNVDGPIRHADFPKPPGPLPYPYPTIVAPKYPTRATPISISSGTSDTCAITNLVIDGVDSPNNENRLYCWGETNGSNASVQVQQPGNPVYTHIDAGSYHTCGITTTTEVICWGINDRGQLGNGTREYANIRSSPTYVLTSGTDQNANRLTGATAISAGNKYTCAVVAEGNIQCWGSDDAGQLGNGDIEEDKLHPVYVLTSGNDQAKNRFKGATAVATSSSIIYSGIRVRKIAERESHTCAIAAGGSVWCWGSNTNGQLGAGTSGAREHNPIKAIASGATSITTGGYKTQNYTTGNGHSCAVIENGKVQCWGYGGTNALGLGNTDSVATPTTVMASSTSEFTGAQTVHAGAGGTCTFSTTNNGALHCWGAILGRNSSPYARSIGTGTTKVSGVSVGEDYVCIVQIVHPVGYGCSDGSRGSPGQQARKLGRIHGAGFFILDFHSSYDRSYTRNHWDN